MGKAGSKGESAKTDARTNAKSDAKSDQDKLKKPPLPPSLQDDDEFFEDGDIATPKRDRIGDDDEPL